MKSMTPYQKKLGTETWFYTKRCFIAMFEMMSKQAIVVEDSVLNTCIQFLEHCERKFFCEVWVKVRLRVRVRVIVRVRVRNQNW